jgi:ribosomal protein L11 methyltransferase
MKFLQIEAVFEAPDASLAEEMICDIFFSFNIRGVICSVPVSETGDHGVIPAPSTAFGPMGVTGYLPVEDTSSATVQAMERRLHDLSRLGVRTRVECSRVDEKDWSHAWKEFFDVTPVTDNIVVKPEWRRYTPKEGEIVIHLDPGMAFGTGTHPTTAMCVRHIQSHIRPGDSFLDIGTGSGILMIAAFRLGAGRLTGIDTDEVAIDVAGQNLDKNSVPRTCRRLIHAPLDQVEPAAYDVIAANIIAGVIIDIAGLITRFMADGGVAVFSGILEDQTPDVTAVLDRHGLKIIETLSQDEWMALAVKKRRDF